MSEVSEQFLPTIKHNPGIFIFKWPNGIEVTVSRMRSDHGDVYGEVVFRSNDKHLHQTKLNFLAARYPTEIANFMERNSGGEFWVTLLKQLAFHVLRIYREGDPVVRLSSSSGLEKVEYLLYPILPLGHPTVIFGEGGVGKSTLALLMSLMVDLALDVEALGGITPSKRVNGLYLDYETNERDIAWKLRGLSKGLNLPETTLLYRRSALPLTEDAPRLHEIILERDIGFLVIDSAGVACGGDLNSAEPVNNMFATLRQMGITSLVLAHTSKEERRVKTPYGSVFFMYQPRSVWELRRVQDISKGEMNLALVHRKANVSALCDPLALNLKFQDNSIMVTSLDINEMPEMSSFLPLEERMTNALSNGLMTEQELANELDITMGEVSGIMRRLLAQGRVRKFTLGWGLA